ncbi:AAA family ATPase [Paraburkholderia fungorum]|uniref:AAA family ATPase n=1 Tax=Paraburkholderia fungorum TaxID=134537 RepID=UPI001C1F0E14|nr:ATP-binding protein [Paraburkholderia fungorum]MBU7438718.1 ATP-binding protein [Paraburkholderia fungorum]
MEHFPIVLGLCRSAMQNGNQALRSHVERLARALEKEKQQEQVEALRKVLKSAESLQEISPSRVVLSRASLKGESLTPSVTAPVDRETGDPLAEIVFPDQRQAERPIFSGRLSKGITDLLEEWRHVDDLRKAGVRPAWATMLFGAPGTGKTMLARHIASELGLPLITARLDGLISSFLGTTARNISNLFAFANRYKCILLLDEFDAVAKVRDDPHELGEIKRVVNTLLQCIDGRAEVGFTIAVTNHESLLDPAVWRRFDIRIEIPKPDVDSRVAMLKRHFSDHETNDTVIRLMAWITEGGSGSDIEKLVDFVRRQQAIRKEKFDFLLTVRNFVQMSAHENQSQNRRLIGEDDDALARMLASDKAVPFSQEQLAMLFGCTQPTISRWLKKDNK